METYRISREVVEGPASAGNVCQIKGHVVPTRGSLQVVPGDVVTVMWKGIKPVMVLDYQVRRGGVEDAPAPPGGVVEELLIATVAGKTDVFFRNATQVTPLGLAKHGVSVPGDAGWGMNKDAFWVQERDIATRFHVFRIARESLTRIIRSGAKIKEKLYTIDIADVTIPVTSLTFTFKRDCGRPYLRSTISLADDEQTFSFGCINQTLNLAKWSDTGVTLERHADTMQMVRTITVTLQGLTPQYVESLAGCRFGQVTASLAGIMLDEHNELLLSLTVNFAAFGAKTSVDGGLTYPGITGSEIQKAEGSGTPVGGSPPCPFVAVEVDPDPSFGPTNNVFNISEQHAQVVQARTGAVVWSTLAPAASLIAENTKEGRWQFVADDLHYNINAVLITLNRWPIPQGIISSEAICVKQRHPLGGLNSYIFGEIDELPAAGGSFYEDNDGAITIISPVDDVAGVVKIIGDVGDDGLAHLDQNLFSGPIMGALSAAQQAAVSKDWTGFLSIQGVPGDNGNTVRDNVGFSAAFSNDGDQFCGPPSANFVWDYTGSWTLAAKDCEFHSVDKIKTYSAEVSAIPYFKRLGLLRSFVVVVQRALRPTTWNDGVTPLTGHESDPTYLTVAITGENIIMLLGPTVVPQGFSAADVQFIAGNERHVLWRLGANLYISTSLGTTVLVGANASSLEAQGLRLPEPDFLYTTTENKRFFVKWKDKIGEFVTLKSGPSFPPKDFALDDLGFLLRTALIALKGPQVQVILDPQILPKKFLNGQ